MTCQLGLDQIAVAPEAGDFIATPPDITRLLLHHCPPPAGAILDPAAGGGAILDVLYDAGRWREELYAVEIRGEERGELLKRVPAEHLRLDSWFKVRGSWWPAPIIITNPPFSLLPTFAEACWPDDVSDGPEEMDYVALLMPIEELAGKQSTGRWLARVGAPTDLIPIPWRPWGRVRGVAWFVWDARRSGQATTTIHLRG